MPQTPEYPSRAHHALPLPLSEMITNTSGNFESSEILCAGRILAEQLRLEGVFPYNPAQAQNWSRDERQKFLQDFVRQAVPEGRVKNFVLSQQPIADSSRGSISRHRAVVYLQPGAYFPSASMAALSGYFGRYNPFSFRFVTRGHPFPERGFRPDGIEGI